MNTQISQGFIKGMINMKELFQGLFIGYILNKFYKNNYKSHNVMFTIVYISVCISLLFIVRECNIYYFEDKIEDKMKYDDFSWPPPVLFGFGLLLFQDKLRSQIKHEYFKVKRV